MTSHITPVSIGATAVCANIGGAQKMHDMKIQEMTPVHFISVSYFWLLVLGKENRSTNAQHHFNIFIFIHHTKIQKRKRKENNKYNSTNHAMAGYQRD